MKLMTKTLATSALLIAFAAPASAMVSSSLSQDVRSAVGSNSNVSVIIDGDKVTLTGYAEDSYAIAQAEIAAKGAGASEVVNNIFRTN